MSKGSTDLRHVCETQQSNLSDWGFVSVCSRLSFCYSILVEQRGMRNAKRGNDTAPDAILNLDWYGTRLHKVDRALSNTCKGRQFSPGKRFLFSDLLYSCHRIGIIGKFPLTVKTPSCNFLET